MGNLLILAVLAMGSLSVSAQSTAGPAKTAAKFGLRQQRFIGEVQNPNQFANYTQFGANFNLEPENPRFFSYKVSALAEGTFEARQELYAGVPEAYLESFNPHLRFSVGRKRRTWSRLDEQFYLGLWQPQLRWDYLAPQQQGLTGLFVDWNISSNWRLSFFTSQVNLPDQGPQYRLNDGKFSSMNRWFQEPNSRVSLFGGTSYASEAPLYYQIDTPPYDELFLQSSFALGLAYDSASGFWTHFNLAYKPRNQIHLGMECTNCGNVGGTTPLEITATIHPKIVKHLLASWEMGFDRVDDRGWFSVSGELPSASGFPEDYEEGALNRMVVAGAAYQHFVGSWLGGRPSWLQYSYMRLFEFPQASPSTLVTSDQVQSSLDRFAFRNLAALDWKIRLSQRASHRLHWTCRYQYSIPERGGWLSSSLDWTQGPLNWNFGLDILGSGVDASSSRAGLFTRYRSNDRVFGGVTYVF